MAYVGRGVGDWVTETTYRYVGAGQGDVMFVAPKRRMYCGLCLCIALALLLLAALIALLPMVIPTTTRSREVAPVIVPAVEKSCIFWGDPHLVTFDGSRPSFYGDGDYWIVKNDKVFIQGRYMGTPYTFGLAATQKVAISGPFINNHLIEVEPIEDGGQIRIDGQSVCAQLGTTCKVEDLATIVHDDKGVLVDEAASQFERHMVHIDLPLGIKMTVFRWTNYIDLEIRMRPLEGGQDGSCGNFNNDPEDDSSNEIFKRIGARVDPNDRLFKDAPMISFSPEEADMLNTCVPEKLKAARQACSEGLKVTTTPTGPSLTELRACMFDECFGMNEHALRTARTYASAADLRAAHLLDGPTE